MDKIPFPSPSPSSDGEIVAAAKQISILLSSSMLEWRIRKIIFHLFSTPSTFKGPDGSAFSDGSLQMFSLQ